MFLSNAQKRILYTELKYPNTTMCNIGGIYKIDTNLDQEKLILAIKQFIKSHDVFSYNFVEENYDYIQRCQNDSLQYNIEYRNFLSGDEFNSYVDKFMKESIDFSKGILYSFCVFRISDKCSGFIVCMHHIISDGFSYSLLVKEITENYEALIDNSEYHFNNEIPQYNYYLEKEEDYLKSNKYDKDCTYWKDIISKIDREDYFIDDLECAGSKQVYIIEKTLKDKIKALAESFHVSINTIFMGLLYLYIYKAQRRSKITVGMPIYNRTNREMKKIIGMFTSTIPIYFEIKSDENVMQFMKRLNLQIGQGIRHQRYPYNDLIENYEQKIDGFFNIVFNYYKGDFDYQLAGKEIVCKEITPKELMFPLNIILRDFKKDVLELEFDFRVNRFSDDQIKVIYNGMINMLNQVLNNSEILIKQIELISELEKKKIIKEFSGNIETPIYRTVVEEFYDQVNNFGEKCAVSDDWNTLSYNDLNNASNVLAHKLIDAGIKKGEAVGIYAYKKVEFIIGIISILKIGAVYVPIDPDLPDENKLYILENSGCDFLLLTNRTINSKLGEVKEIEINIDLSETSSVMVENSIKDTAYIMFTSGTTGAPKGVEIPISGIVRLVKSPNYITFKNTMVMAQTGSLSFDAATFEIWGALLNGLSLHILQKETVLDIDAFKKEIENRNINIMWLTAQLFKQICIDDITLFDKVDIVVTGGEVVSPYATSKLLEYKNTIKVICGYGPTENTTFTTCYTVENSWPEEKSLPIGTPISGTQVYILDLDNNLQPVGIPGELCTSGYGLGKGYINNEELTNQKFEQCPYSSNRLMYHTGDLAKINEKGEIIFLGREDKQVKINGFRIELDGIENRISKFEGLSTCRIIVDDKDDLLCFYTALDDIPESKVREYAIKVLPPYMVPTHYYRVKNIPMTNHGKVDNNKLLAMKSENFQHKESLEDLNHNNELRKIWMEILGCDLIPDDAGFMELGGNSMKAMTLRGEIKKRLNIQLPMKLFLRNMTFKDMEDYIMKSADKGSAIPTTKSITKYKATSAQARMYFAQAMDKKSVAYNVPILLKFGGYIDENLLLDAIRVIVQRHVSLRVVFEIENNTVYQSVIQPQEIDSATIIKKVDLVEDSTDQLFSKYVIPFDLEHEIPIHCFIIKNEGYVKYLLVDVHHIAFDGISTMLFIKELKALCEHTNLEPLETDYIEYAKEEEEYLNSRDASNIDKIFWKEQMNGYEPFDFPTCFNRKIIKSTMEGDSVITRLDNTLLQKLERLAKNNNVSLYPILMSGFNILLSKFSMQNDIAIGTVMTGRNTENLYKVIGMFANTTIIREKIRSDELYLSYLTRLETDIEAVMEHMIYPYEQIVSDNNIVTDSSRNPIFDFMFAYNEIPDMDFKINNQQIDVISCKNTVAKFDITLDITKTADELVIDFQYSKNLFNKAFMNTVMNSYLHILEEISSNNKLISDIRVVSENDLKKINSFNGESRILNESLTMYKIFKKCSSLYADHIAIESNEESITYQELDNIVSKITHILFQKNVKKGDIIAVSMDRNYLYIATILAISCIGAVFLPLDKTLPEERKKYILSDSNTKYYLSDTDANADLVIDKYSLEDVHNLITDFSYSVDCNDPLYVIYTSGTTGKPKGAVIRNRGIVNLVEVFLNNVGISNYDKVLQFANFSFDASIFEITMAILTGSTLCMIDKNTIQDIFEFERYLKRHKVTVAIFPPAYFKNLNPDINTYLRIVFTGGASAVKAEVEPWLDKLIYINAYGPTETTICATMKIFPLKGKIIGDNVSIGSPLYNTKIKILDENCNEQPIGVPGEIYIGGDIVGLGYLNRLELTNEKFVEFDDGVYYKSGDLGKWLENGEIQFVGRKDEQIKYHGYRIEIEEIENLLKDIKFVDDAAVVYDTTNGMESLSAYYTSDQLLDKDIILGELRRKIPSYMIPGNIIRIDEMPLTINGKVDKKKLNEYGIIATNKEIIVPRNSIEENILKIWKDILGLTEISIDTSFYEVGGNSISMIAVIAEIEKKFHIAISYKKFVELQTIEKIANYLSTQTTINTDKIIYHSYGDDFKSFPLTKVQMAYYLGRNSYTELGGYGTHAYVEIQTTMEVPKFEKAFNKLISRHPMLRAVITDKAEQRILESVDYYKIKYVDISGANNDYKNKVIVEKRDEMENEVFDYTRWPLFRIEAFKLNENLNYLCVSIDGIISDGSSMQILSKELVDLYNDKSLPDISKVTFRDYVLSYKEYENTVSYKKDKEFWKEKIKEFPLPPQLPMKTHPEQIDNPHFKRLSSSISVKKWEAIKNLCKNNQITPSVLLCTIYADILSVWSGQKDLGINLSIFNRYPFNAEINHIIGDFTSIILLDLHSDRSKSLYDRCKDTQITLLEALQHRGYDGVDVIRDFSKEKKIGNKAAMPIVFTSMLRDEDYDTADRILGELKYGISQTPQVYIDMQVSASKHDGLIINWDYVEELFDEYVIENMFEQMIQQISNAGDMLNKCSVNLTAYQKKVWEKYNDTTYNFERSSTLSELFVEQVRKNPNKIAIEKGEIKLTYKELDERSDQVAAYIVKNTEDKDKLVGIDCDRSIESIINVIAVIKTGKGYVPIDSTYPKERKNYIVKQAGLELVLDSKLCNLAQKENQISIYNRDIVPDSIAYVIFTSGSTGNPKGVEITHRAAINTILDINTKFNVTCNDRIIGLSSMSFDLSVYDIFGSFIVGATLIMIDDQRDVKAVYATLSEKKVTIWNSVPSTMQMLIEYLEDNDKNDLLTGVLHTTPMKNEIEIENPHKLFSDVLNGSYIDEDIVFIKENYDKFKLQQQMRVMVNEEINSIELKEDLNFRSRFDRSSCRTFSNEEIPFSIFSKMFSVFSSVKQSDCNHYCYASAGGLYPIDLYIYVKDKRVEKIPEGFYYYSPLNNKIYKINNMELTDEEQIYSNKEIFNSSAISVFCIYNANCNMPKYGSDGYFYAIIETGIILQLFTQVAKELGLSICSIGTLKNDACIRQSLKLTNSQQLIHSFEMGIPDGESISVTEEESDQDIDKGDNSHLRLVMLSGDYIPTSLPDKIRKYFNSADVISLGGATEAAIWSIYYPIQTVESTWQTIPYGYPLANQKMYVIDEFNNLCPPEVLGEIVIAGTGVAEGYINNDKLTEKSFISLPHLGRIYKTGDYGILSKTGYIKFMGRRDSQVKINGYRIELGEIEQKIMKYKGVNEIAIVAQEDNKKQKYLVAFVVGNEELTVENLRAFLIKELPIYMVPRIIKKVSLIPLTSNGKVDKKALENKKVVTHTEHEAKEKTLPRTELENRLCKIWINVLGISDIGVKDSLFEIGGDSVTLVRLHRKIDEEFPGILKIMDIFENYTIEMLAKKISSKLEEQTQVKCKHIATNLIPEKYIHHTAISENNEKKIRSLEFNYAFDEALLKNLGEDPTAILNASFILAICNILRQRSLVVYIESKDSFKELTVDLDKVNDFKSLINQINDAMNIGEKIDIYNINRQEKDIKKASIGIIQNGSDIYFDVQLVIGGSSTQILWDIEKYSSELGEHIKKYMETILYNLCAE